MGTPAHLTRRGRGRHTWWTRVLSLITVAAIGAGVLPWLLPAPFAGIGDSGSGAHPIIAAPGVRVRASSSLSSSPSPSPSPSPPPALLRPVLEGVVARAAEAVALPRGLQVSVPRAGPKGSRSGRIVVYGSQEAWGGYVSGEFFALFRTLRHLYAWEFLDASAASWTELEALLLRDGRAAPDLLVFMESWELATWGARDARLPSVWVMTNDLHWFDEETRVRKSFVLKTCASAIVGPYVHLLRGFFPEVPVATTLIPLPHAASAQFLLPLNPDPLAVVLLAGAVSEYYPYRALVAAKIAAGDARFTQLPHPGWGDLSSVRDSPAVGPNFATSLRAHLAVITDGLVFNYTVAKLFEVPACGALLLVNTELVPALADLGMHAGTHYVAYSRATLDAVVDWVLLPSSRPAVDAIRAQGQALVWARHTVFHRAAALDAAAQLHIATRRKSPR